MTRLALSVAALLALACAEPADARSVTREEAARLVGIALVTEWVAEHCDVSRLSAMLLLTMPLLLKQLEPDKLAIGRKRVRDKAARYPSKAAACEDLTKGLVSVQ